jgi:glycosyltransferase involved in cell wall biosynthesis
VDVKSEPGVNPITPSCPILTPLPPGLPRPFWSVVIPTCNRTVWLEQCLRSVLDQRIVLDDMEVLVQDDHSDNDLRPLVDSIASDHPVKFERNDARLGQFPSVNRAIRRSVGRWVHILHDDDFVRPGFYKTFQASLSKAPPDVGMAGCRYTVLHLPAHREWRPDLLRPDAGILPDWLARLSIDNPHNVCAVVHRRDTFEQLGLFREDLPFCADWESYVRAALRFRWWYQPEDMAVYRVHGQSETAKLEFDLADNLRRAVEIISDYLPPAVRDRVIPLTRLAHGRRFLHQAWLAFQRGNAALGLSLLEQCVRLGGAVPHSPEFANVLRHPLAEPFRLRQTSGPGTP